MGGEVCNQDANSLLDKLPVNYHYVKNQNANSLLDKLPVNYHYVKNQNANSLLDKLPVNYHYVKGLQHFNKNPDKHILSKNINKAKTHKLKKKKAQVSKERGLYVITSGPSASSCCSQSSHRPVTHTHTQISTGKIACLLVLRRSLPKKPSTLLLL